MVLRQGFCAERLRQLLPALLCPIIVVVSGCRPASRQTIVAVPVMVSQSLEPVPSADAVAKAEHITADGLYTVYSQDLNNGANRDQRFLNRLIVVTGVFNGVNRSLRGRVYLELCTHADGAFTYAELSPDAAPLLSTLTPGDTMKLLCRGGGMAIGSPLLRDCRSV